MAYNDNQIKVDASKRELNNKITNLITDTDDDVFWYIRFNLPLDEQSISNKTMKVTDTKGFVIRTNIVYNKALELIIINPLEKYVKDEYYILHISKKVKSENMQQLKKDVHILFKIKEGQLVDFKEIEENVIVPTPRISFYDAFKNVAPAKERKQTKSRVYSFTEEQERKLEEARKDDNKLPYLNLKINPTIAIIGAILFFLGSILSQGILTTIGIFTSIVGFTILVLQMQVQEFKSNFFYNVGVINFNRGNYKRANKNFKKAVNINSNNELAEYALNKSLFFM